MKPALGGFGFLPDIANEQKIFLGIVSCGRIICCARGEERKFVVTTTNSQHNPPIYPNLAAQIELTGLDQLWVADIGPGPS